MAGESNDISTGAKITAAQFNDLVTRYNKFWQGSTFSFDSFHSTDPERRYGWGQPNAVYPTVSTNEIITANHTNHLLAQINAGLWHIEEDEMRLYPSRDAKSSIRADLYVELRNVFDNIFETYKFDAEAVGEWDTPVEIIRQGIITWEDDLYCEIKYSFTDYDEARHYFNSGGQFSIQLSSSGGSGILKNNWKELFDTIGEIRIGATSSSTTGDNKGIHVNRGFYDMLTVAADPGDPYPHPYVIIFDAAGWKEHTSENSPSEYSYIYVQSEYNSRRVQVYLRGEDNTGTGGTFDIFLKVVLLEDDDESLPIDSTITANAGFLEIFETPVLSEPNLTYFTVEDTVYQFEQPQNPSVAAYSIWTEVDLPSGQQLDPDWNENDPGVVWEQTESTTDSDYLYHQKPE